MNVKLLFEKTILPSIIIVAILSVNPVTWAKIESKSFPGPTLVDDFAIIRLAPGLKNQTIGPLFEYRKQLAIRETTYHMVRLDNPLGHLHVITARDEGCPGRATVSETSHRVGCQVAVNAGFFDMATGDCIGNVVSRNHLYQLSGLRNTNIGWTNDGRMIMGYVTTNTIYEWPWTNLVSGLLWLVRDGEPFWEQSNLIEGPDFVDIRAPRTVIGVDRWGRVYLLMIEGVEFDPALDSALDPTLDPALNQALKNKRIATGLTIPELADLVLSLGMTNAVNLDGGGSSNFFLNGQLQNEVKELCPDNPSAYCERPVTTIICIK